MNMNYGRRQIFTDERKIEYGNLLDVLRKALNIHELDANDMDFLINYEAGKVNPLPEKTYQKDIQNFVPDPIAACIVDFKLGFEWSNPITFVQSDDDDDTNNETDITKAISLLNQGYRAQNIKSKQQALARFVEICGVGYSYVDVNMEYEDGDSFFTVEVLDPRTTFVVRSNAYTDKRIVLAVSYRKDENGIKHFTCFTRDSRFEVTGYDDIVEEMNPLGKIPIIEWIRSYDRQGCFERLVPMIDDVTNSLSMLLDGIQQNVDAIWWMNDAELETKVVTNEDGTSEEVTVTPKSGDWLQTKTAQNGKTPILQPLTADYHNNSILESVAATRGEILRIAHVPQRNDNSGGSTGVAMEDAAGWTDAEAEACRKQMLSDSSKMNEASIVLTAIKVSPYVPADSPLLKLRYSDIQPNFKRSKSYDLNTKINAICTGVSHGFALEDLVSNIALFEDNNQVIARSGEGVRKYQETIWRTANQAEGGEGEKAVNSDRMMQDLSDQIDNSPALNTI